MTEAADWGRAVAANLAMADLGSAGAAGLAVAAVAGWGWAAPEEEGWEAAGWGWAAQVEEGSEAAAGRSLAEAASRRAEEGRAARD